MLSLARGRRHKGFTLLELMIVIIIIAVLATLGLQQYSWIVEKGRTSEARGVLGQLRKAERAYYLERGVYTNNIDDLLVAAPLDCNQDTHYYSYSCDFTGSCNASRCTTGGKSPSIGTSYYFINMQNGSWISNFRY